MKQSDHPLFHYTYYQNPLLIVVILIREQAEYVV